MIGVFLRDFGFCFVSDGDSESGLGSRLCFRCRSGSDFDCRGVSGFDFDCRTDSDLGLVDLSDSRFCFWRVSDFRRDSSRDTSVSGSCFIRNSDSGFDKDFIDLFVFMIVGFAKRAVPSKAKRSLSRGLAPSKKN